MTVSMFENALDAKKHLRLDTLTLRELSARAVFPWFADAVTDWIVIAGALAIIQIWPNPCTLIAGILAVGNRQHALAILGHDGAHYTLSRIAALNDFLSNVFCFWPLGLTASGYRALHYRHHSHTGTDDDPELGHKRMRAPQWDLPAKPLTILRYALLDLIGCSLPDYLIIVRFSKPCRRREYFPLALFHVTLAALLVSAGLWLAAAMWYWSLFTSFMMCFRLRLWLEHQGTADTQRLALTAWQGALLAPHNAWHHWEHHKYPTIPYHRLPAVRRLLIGPTLMTLQGLADLLAATPQIPSGTALKTRPEKDITLPNHT